jgi:hypothetical protein
MKIDRVTVKYGELRSDGYPSFSNKTIAVELSAQIESGETANEVKDILFRHAKAATKREFGEKIQNDDQMDIPF